MLGDRALSIIEIGGLRRHVELSLSTKSFRDLVKRGNVLGLMKDRINCCRMALDRLVLGLILSQLVTIVMNLIVFQVHYRLVIRNSMCQLHLIFTSMEAMTPILKDQTVHFRAVLSDDDKQLSRNIGGCRYLPLQ